MSATASMDERLISLVQQYEPVLNYRLTQEGDHACAGRCGRRLSGPIALCVRCRQTNSHPSLAMGQRPIKDAPA